MFYKVKIKKLPQAKTGMQVQGALFNDFAGMASSNRNTTSEESKLIESKYIKAVPVDKANVEAEGGETVYGDINGDGIPEHKIIKGPRHTHGGVPLNLPEDTFIFSDTPGMRIKDPEVLKSFGFTAKSGGYTPAAIAKRYDVDKYRKILEDSNSDAIEKRTAELMIKKYIVKLGCLALEQESMKGFPQGIPVAAKPCMQARGLTEEDILPDEKLSGLNDQLKKQKEQQEQQANSAQTLGSENQEAQAMSMNQGQPVAQAQPTEQPMSQEGMMKFGGMRRLRRANEGMQQPSEEEMMMMMQQQQQQQQQPQQGGGDQMQQIMQQVGQALQQGAAPEEVAAQLIQSQIPPEQVAEIFVQLGMPQDQVQQLIASIMQQMQGAQEEMMRWGGQRRLRRAQQGMAQPSEEEMMMMMQQQQAEQGQGQAQGGDQEQMMEIIQEVQAALQKGISPPEIVLSLLQNNLPPEAIVQIFVQLGASEQEAVGLVQQSMSQVEQPQGQGMAQRQPSEEEMMAMQQQQMQQAPMAEYGMAMGGYPMPFYDMPEAKQGAVIDNYSNRRYSRSNNLPKAGPGITIDATTMDDAALRRAIYDAQQKDPTAIITVNRKGKDGKVTSERLDTKNSGWKLPTGDDIKASDLNGFDGSSANGRLAAAQYMLIKQNLENSTVKAQIIKNAREALENPDAWTGKGGTRNNNNKWSIQFPGAPPSDQEIIDAALAHQKRNLMFESQHVDPQLFNDDGDALSSASHVVSKEYINPDTQKPYTLAEATKAKKDLERRGFTNTTITAQKLKVDLSSNRKDRILQQSTMHAYGKAYKDFTDGKFKADADAQYAMNNFLGNVNMATAGANDERSMARLYGPMGAKISPLDGIVGNTDAGHRFVTASNNYAFSPVENPDCQCTDPTNTATYSKLKDKDGKCTCTEEVKKCPCGEEMLEPVNGVCPPCEKEITIKKPAPPAEFWLQDTIKTLAAASDLAGVKNYGPMAQRFDMQDPRPNFVDPTRELARQREDASMLTAGLEGFAGGQDLSVRSTGIQSQLAKSAADTLSAYDNKNVGIADAFEIKGTDIMNQERTANSNAGALLYRENTIGNQQYDNSKRALTGNLVNQYTNAITNKWKTDATNQMYPQFAVSSGVGGRMFYKGGKDHQIDTSNDTAAWEEAYDWCLARKDKDPSSCATRRMASKNKSQDQQGPNSYPGANNSYPGVAGVGTGSDGKYGGPIFKDGGYIDIASWLPYLK